MAEKDSNPRPNLGADRLFAASILQHGTLSALREAGVALLKFDAEKRRDLFDELTDEPDRQYKQLMYEALSEIEADVAIKRASKGSI
jgi:hypothetical protein